MWAFANNEFVLLEEASLPVTDLALQRGYAVFDYFRTLNKVPLFFDDHMNRLKKSAAEMRLTIPTDNSWWKKIIQELIQKNNIAPSSGIRINITGGNSADNYHPATPHIIITEHSLTMPSIDQFTKGLKLITYEYLRDLPSIKSINYLMAVWLQNQVKDAGADEVLYKKNEIISELPRANIFIVSNAGQLVTPAENVLEGITRKKILEARIFSDKIIKKAITVADLFEAKEVFICSTTKRILPVCTIDGHVVGTGSPGPLTTAINQYFLQMEKEFASTGE
jgi:D-alanine transaminase/branched-chain amino acid aminotransferase